MLERGGAMSGSPTVLLADVDAVSRERRARQLEDRGFHVTVARTGFETIVKASCHLPDLIVIALRHDTAETVELLATCPATAHIPVLRLPHGRGVPGHVRSGAVPAHAR
jgi:CheY-like chemotaxis protein